MQPGRLLDLACGNGDLTGMMAAHFEEVVGLDASSTHIAEAHKQHPGLTFVHSLAEDDQR